jgi:hypothetical protein
VRITTTRTTIHYSTSSQEPTHHYRTVETSTPPYTYAGAGTQSPSRCLDEAARRAERRARRRAARESKREELEESPQEKAVREGTKANTTENEGFLTPWQKIHVFRFREQAGSADEEMKDAGVEDAGSSSVRVQFSEEVVYLEPPEYPPPELSISDMHMPYELW